MQDDQWRFAIVGAELRSGVERMVWLSQIGTAVRRLALLPFGLCRPVLRRSCNARERTPSRDRSAGLSPAVKADPYHLRERARLPPLQDVRGLPGRHPA